MILPPRFVEAQTTEGGVHWQGYENHPRPSGADRPYLRFSSNQPISLEQLQGMVAQGVPIFVDGQLTCHGAGRPPLTAPDTAVT